MRTTTPLVLAAALAAAPQLAAKTGWEVDLGLALVQLGKGDASGAASSLKRARRAIGRVQEEHLDLAMAMLRVSTSLAKSGKHREALVLADEATSLFEARRREGHPDLSTPHLARANILVRMKRWGDAEDAFRSALRSLARDERRDPETQRAAMLGLAAAMAERGKGDLAATSRMVTEEFGTPGAAPARDEARARQVRTGASLMRAGRAMLATKAAAATGPTTPAEARQQIQALRAQVEPILARARRGEAAPTRMAQQVREADALVKADAFFDAASFLVANDPPGPPEAAELLAFHQDYAAAVEAGAVVLDQRFFKGLVRDRYLELRAKVRAEDGPVAALYEALRQRAAEAP